MYSNPMDRLYPTGMLLLPHLGLRGAIRPLQANHPLVHKEARQVLVSSVVDCLSVLETLFSSTGYGNGQERKGLEWGVRVSVARPSQTYDGHCCCYKGKGHRRGGGGRKGAGADALFHKTRSLSGHQTSMNVRAESTVFIGLHFFYFFFNHHFYFPP